MKHFSLEEFACPCCGKCDMQEDFLEAIDLARDSSGVPFTITSGYRCEKHNKEVGGIEGSAHTKGYASDISITSSETRCKALRAILLHFSRVGISKSFIHVDMDPEKPSNVLWLY